MALERGPHGGARVPGRRVPVSRVRIRLLRDVSFVRRVSSSSSAPPQRQDDPVTDPAFYDATPGRPGHGVNDSRSEPRRVWRVSASSLRRHSCSRTVGAPPVRRSGRNGHELCAPSRSPRAAYSSRRWRADSRRRSRRRHDVSGGQPPAARDRSGSSSGRDPDFRRQLSASTRHRCAASRRPRRKWAGHPDHRAQPSAPIMTPIDPVVDAAGWSAGGTPSVPRPRDLPGDRVLAAVEAGGAA